MILVLAFTLTGCGVVDVVAPASVTTLPLMHELDPGQDLLVLGDWGAGTPEQQQVASAMAEVAATREPAAIVTTGDNFYSDDATSLMEPFAWTRDDEIPFVIAWGNHDVESRQRVELLGDTFDDPPRWASHRWGEVDLVILDSTQVDSPEQAEFLTQTLAEDDDPTIVVLHHSPYSCGYHGDTGSVIDRWVEGFDDDVLLVLSGHEHTYQRFENGGTTFVVTGGGGAGLTDLKDCPPDHPKRSAGQTSHHFVTLHQDDGLLRVSAIGVDGEVFDEIALPLP